MYYPLRTGSEQGTCSGYYPPLQRHTPVEKTITVPGRRLVIFDVNRVLLWGEPNDRGTIRPRGIRAKHKFLYPRPFLLEFLERCCHLFDVGIWSCMITRNVREQLALVNILPKLASRIKFIRGQESLRTIGNFSNKPIFIKSFEYISEDLKGYEKENILLVDDSPYKTSFNTLHSSLYPDPYEGSEDDSFLKDKLFPCLRDMSNGTITFHKYIESRCPRWSIENIRKDWVEKEKVWRIQAIQCEGDPLHLRRFHEYMAII